MNKKGSSLMELVISIALMAVILVFLVKLLVDINDMNTNNTYAKDNQVNRAEIIRYIENDISDKKIISIVDNSTDGNIKITINFDGGISSSIEATENSLTYTPSDPSKKRAWDMVDATIYTNLCRIESSTPSAESDSSEGSNSSNGEISTFTINIEVNTLNNNNTHPSSDSNKYHNNIVDDIIISYMGEGKIDLPESKCIGTYCKKNT